MASLSKILNCQASLSEGSFSIKCIAGIVGLDIQIVADETKEGFEDGVTGIFKLTAGTPSLSFYKEWGGYIIKNLDP
jgi:hypothetical protein